MIQIAKSIFDNILMIEPSDPLYDCLPRLTGRDHNEIYTIQRIPARYHTEIQNGQEIKVETTQPMIRIFLVFDINNQLYPSCISNGVCTIHRYDTMVVVHMDSNYRMDADVEFYFDLLTPLRDMVVHEQSLSSGRRYYGDAKDEMTFISYSWLYQNGKTSSMIDKQITHVALVGGMTKQEVSSYDQFTNTKMVTLKDTKVTGILETISDKLIHF